MMSKKGENIPHVEALFSKGEQGYEGEDECYVDMDTSFKKDNPIQVIPLLMTFLGHTTQARGSTKLDEDAPGQFTRSSKIKDDQQLTPSSKK